MDDIKYLTHRCAACDALIQGRAVYCIGCYAECTRKCECTLYNAATKNKSGRKRHKGQSWEDCKLCGGTGWVTDGLPA